MYPLPRNTNVRTNHETKRRYGRNSPGEPMDSLGTGFSRTTTTHGAPRVVCRAAGAPTGEAEPTRRRRPCQSWATGRPARDRKGGFQGAPRGDHQTLATVHGVRGAGPGPHADEVPTGQGPDRPHALLRAQAEDQRWGVGPGEPDGRGPMIQDLQVELSRRQIQREGERPCEPRA